MEAKSIEFLRARSSGNAAFNILTLSFSAVWSFEELLKEERTCRQEIRAYEKKIENWSRSVKSDPSGNTASTPKV